jgi:hypothetical protein
MPTPASSKESRRFYITRLGVWGMGWRETGSTDQVPKSGLKNCTYSLW